jgi:hypothetical protein
LRSHQRCKDSKTDKHSATETMAKTPKSRAVQGWREGVGSQGVDAVGYRGDGHKEETERKALR